MSTEQVEDREADGEDDEESRGSDGDGIDMIDVVGLLEEKTCGKVQ